MYYWMIAFFILSIISVILGYAGFSSMTIRHLGKMTFGTFIILFVLTAILHLLTNKNEK